MNAAKILKDRDFEEISEVRPDSKKRITLKKVGRLGRYYKVYINFLGQIILDPLVAIPASDLWLLQDKKALASLKRGIADAAAGRVVSLPSLTKPGGRRDRALRPEVHGRSRGPKKGPGA